MPFLVHHLNALSLMYQVPCLLGNPLTAQPPSNRKNLVYFYPKNPLKWIPRKRNTDLEEESESLGLVLSDERSHQVNEPEDGSEEDPVNPVSSLAGASFIILENKSRSDQKEGCEDQLSGVRSSEASSFLDVSWFEVLIPH